MITYKSNCGVCKTIRKDKKLTSRIYGTSFYIPHSKDSLRKVAQDCATQAGEGQAPFTYQGILNHCKKHQHLNQSDFSKKMLEQKQKIAQRKQINAMYEAESVQDAIMNRGMELLDSGEMSIKADHLLKAAKDKQDFQSKVRDQLLQLAEMVAFYASGEDNSRAEVIDDRRIIEIESYDPAVPIAENIDTRSN